MPLPSDFFIITFLNKHLYPCAYPINAVLLNAVLYIRVVIFNRASYKCRLKNKAVLILSKRYYLGFSLLMLMIF